MKRILFAVMLLAASMAGAQQEDYVLDDRWYVGFSGGMARPGAERLTDSTEWYLGVNIGRFYSPNFSLDFQLDSYSTDFERDKLLRNGVGLPLSPSGSTFERQYDLYGYGLTGRYHFGEYGQKHRPYGLLGLGIQEHRNAFNDGRDMYFSWGLGIQSRLGENVHLRTQLEGRYDNDRETFDRSKGYVDMIASIGLGFSFGEPPRPPQPAPPPEPAAPAPAPPPPAPAPEPQPEPEVMFEFDSTVLFAFDSSQLRDEARAELNRAADILAPRDDLILVEVAGHTDSIGDEAYNQELSVRRAQAVADHLADNGVARNRMRVVGYGETRPKVANDTPENRQINRRVVVSILDRRD